jgi:hypothetical protein
VFPSWAAEFERFLLPLAPASYWLEGFANCTPTSGIKEK